MIKRTARNMPHGRIFAHWMPLPAWRQLTCPERALLVELITRYRPTMENLFSLSDRQIAAMLNCSRSTAAKAIARLEECGWVEVERIGKMRGTRDKRASAYSLTTAPRVIGEPEKFTFIKWRPPSSTAKNMTANGLNCDHQRPKIEPIYNCEIFKNNPSKH